MKNFIIKIAGVLALVLLGAVSVKAQSTPVLTPSPVRTTSSTSAQSGKATYTIALPGLNEQKAAWLKELEKEDVVETVNTNVAAGTCTVTVFHPETMTQERVKASLENHLVYRGKSTK